MMADEDFYEPVSLGLTCETKYQISRVASGRLYPGQSEMAFRYAIRQPDHGSSFFGWRLFDWQDTPLETVCDYIERDFENVFRLEDFELTCDHGVPASGGVIHKRLKTVHVHEFPPPRGVDNITLEQVAAQYDAARRMFDRLVDDFRRLLTLPGPYLYVISHPTYPNASVLSRLIRLLASRSDKHRFHILVVGREGFDNDLSSLGDRVTKAWRSIDAGGKPDAFGWEGHDPSWDRAFAPFPIGFYKGGFHDPGSPWAPNPISDEVANEVFAAPHPNFPPRDARVLREWGPEAIFSSPMWRAEGAQLDLDDDGASLVSPPSAWHYGHAAQIDFDGVDGLRQRAWLKIEFADVGGGPLLASIYDRVNDEIAEETLVDQGEGSIELVLKIRDFRKDMFLLRTGATAASARARLKRIQLIVDARGAD